MLTWSDNSMVRDKSSGVTNLMAAVGYIRPNGGLKFNSPVQLTDFETQYPGFQFGIFDTAATIVRSGPHKGRIVVSYGTVDYNVPSSPANAYIYTCRCISEDGIHWPLPFDGVNPIPFNGFTNIQPTGPAGLGDGRGVLSDKYGNVWYVTSNHLSPDGTYINQATLWVSTDGGDTYSVFYTVDVVENETANDFPQVALGTNAFGQYGLYFALSYLYDATADGFLSLGFIPINGFNNFGTTEFVILNELPQALVTPDITASDDGRVWTVGNDSGFFAPPYSFIQPLLLGYKSPGETLDINWAGGWDTALINNVGQTWGDNGFLPADFPVTISEPAHGFLPCSPTSILFDKTRSALYCLVAYQSPDYSQNMNLDLIISRDNGMTWSKPLSVSNSKAGNRGFQTMTLDESTGVLIISWYDGRKDSTYESLEYMYATISKKKLDRIVFKIPLSNPQFIGPSVSNTLAITDTISVEHAFFSKDKLMNSKKKLKKKLANTP